MAERVQIQKPAPQERKAEPEVQVTGEKADLSATDALLDEIDSLLDETLGEQTEEEYLALNVQRGGQ